MIAAVYVPLWVPAAVICVLCLLPGLPDEARRAIAGTRGALRNRRERRELDRLWEDEDVDGGRSAIELVATTRGPAPVAVDDLGGAA